MSQANLSTQKLSSEFPASSPSTKAKAGPSSQVSEAYSLPLSALRNHQTWLILSGQRIDATEATEEELNTFFEGAVNVVNLRKWSIFVRWHALNRGINAGTLRLAEEKGEYIVSKTEAFSSSQETKTEEKSSARLACGCVLPVQKGGWANVMPVERLSVFCQTHKWQNIQQLPAIEEEKASESEGKS